MTSPLPVLVAGMLRARHGGTFNYRVQTMQKENAMLDITLTNEQKVRVTASPVTQAGNPAPLDGPVSWSVESGDATINVIDATTAELVSGDNPGDSIVLVTADADLGAGIETVADTVRLHVEGARAQNLGLVAGAPELK